MSNDVVSLPNRTQSVRTVPDAQRPPFDAPTRVQDAANDAESDAQEFPRTKQPTSTALADRPPTGPGGWARQAAADWFDRCIERRWDANEMWASNRALAKQTKSDEKIIRQVRDGRKALSVAMLLVLPAPLVADVVSWIQDQRALTAHRRALPMLRDALDRIDQPIAAEDKGEAIAALGEAQRRIGDRILKLATEGK